jgi:predicted dehydrogenase
MVARSAPGCRAFDSADALLGARVVDAVVIAAPMESRASLTVSALGAGLPVLVEPPMAASLEEADWIREAERAARLSVMVGFNRRWWEPAEQVRRALAGAPEGELVVESTIAIDVSDPDPFVALGAHLDLVRHMVDREIAIISGLREATGELEAHVTFHGGGLASCRARPAERPEESIIVRASGRTYQIWSGSDRIRPPSGRGRRALDLLDTAVRRVGLARDAVARSYDGLLGGFVHSVQTRRFRGPTTSDGTAALLAIAALRRSLEEGGTEMMVPATPGKPPEAD